ncbi:hypothetical protein R3P38DRAFT_503346 [Favolaschia claudopus]|uniref:Uncharacterized protein n=1 Tax=Favolaschia claudopus TaxID=2862362 RepID=A0AAV9ZCT4_9AGAR
MGPAVEDYVCLEGIRTVAKALTLNTDIEDLVVLRVQYRTILDLLKERAGQERRHLVVLTGQPGIGKTTFLIYLLLHRLEHRLPTAVQLHEQAFMIFDDCGVSIYNALEFDDDALHDRLVRCWALSDSNQHSTTPCVAVATVPPLVVITSAPEPSRWKELVKQLGGGGDVMFLPLPTVMEVGAVIKALQLDVSQTLSLVGKWGPSPRTVLQILRDPERVSKFSALAEAAARSLAQPESHQVFFRSDYGLLSTMVGSHLVFVDADGAAPSSYRCRALIPTAFLRKFIEQASLELDARQAYKLYCMLSYHSLLRTDAGWPHETATHEKLMSEKEVS